MDDAKQKAATPPPNDSPLKYRILQKTASTTTIKLAQHNQLDFFFSAISSVPTTDTILSTDSELGQQDSYPGK